MGDTPTGYDTCGIHSNEPIKITDDGKITSHIPRFPEFAIGTVLLRSFKDWPKAMKQTPEELSEAGFFLHGQR